MLESVLAPGEMCHDMPCGQLTHLLRSAHRIGSEATLCVEHPPLKDCCLPLRMPALLPLAQEKGALLRLLVLAS